LSSHRRSDAPCKIKIFALLFSHGHLLSFKQKIMAPPTATFQDSTLVNDNAKNTILDPLLPDHELVPAVLYLLHQLLPDTWGHVKTIKLDRISGALTNCIYVATSQYTDTVQKVLVRVYGQGSEAMFERSKEMLWLERLSKQSLVPRLLSVFGNGRFEEYLESTTLKHDTLRDPRISTGIARLLRRLHGVTDVHPHMPENGDLEWWASIGRWMPSTETIVRRLQETNEDERWEEIDLEQLKLQINAYKQWVDKIDSKIVYCHNDLQYGNVLVLQDGPGVTIPPSSHRQVGDTAFVDFEYGGYNPRGYDIANHFCEWKANYHCDEAHVLHPVLYPTLAEQKRFLREYLGHYRSEDDVNMLHAEVEAYRPASELSWALWGLVQVGRTDIDFDYMGYGLGRIREFRRQLRKLGI